ncbi:unnamed protein product [Trichogramma brassicae]|uniref:Uncharacterized protein n=1 Tax=Trichogramma brassicae TaxID=86971 RepID=A0A6H5IMF0_9HYME|nr:unnamed protein product [Trichogramma brassicae]
MEREPRSGRPRYIIHESNYCYNTKITVSEFGFSIRTTPEYATPRYYIRSTLRLQQAAYIATTRTVYVSNIMCATGNFRFYALPLQLPVRSFFSANFLSEPRINKEAKFIVTSRDLRARGIYYRYKEKRWKSNTAARHIEFIRGTRPQAELARHPNTRLIRLPGENPLSCSYIHSMYWTKVGPAAPAPAISSAEDWGASQEEEERKKKKKEKKRASFGRPASCTARAFAQIDIYTKGKKSTNTPRRVVASNGIRRALAAEGNTKLDVHARSELVDYSERACLPASLPLSSYICCRRRAINYYLYTLELAVWILKFTRRLPRGI